MVCTYDESDWTICPRPVPRGRQKNRGMYPIAKRGEVVVQTRFFYLQIKVHADRRVMYKGRVALRPKQKKGRVEGRRAKE